MKKLLFWAIMAFALCGCGDEAVDINSLTQQTVFVYMPWSGSSEQSGLYEIFLQNLDSIESAIIKKGGLGKTRVLVFLSQTANSSTLYEVNYENGSCSHKTIRNYDGHDYTTVEGLTTIFNEVKRSASALNYALIVGCHGTGWTPFEAWQNYPFNAKPSLSGPSAQSSALQVKQNNPSADYPRTRFFGSVTDSNYATNITTLAEAIGKAGLHMQFILFDDCYMANVETAYELRNVTNFLIASTSEVMDIGMPYADMWASLNSSTPKYSTAVSAFKNYYDSYNPPCGTIAAIDCRQMDNLADIMRQINTQCTFDESLLESVQLLDGFNVPLFYDFGDYVSKLCTDPYLLETFTNQMAKTVSSMAATEQIYSYLYVIPQFIPIKSFSGLTISDPSQNPVALRAKTSTNWWKATH